jgi:hypothetical protein
MDLQQGKAVLALRKEVEMNKMPACITFGLCSILRRHETSQINYNINTALKSI